MGAQKNEKKVVIMQMFDAKVAAIATGEANNEYECLDSIEEGRRMTTTNTTEQKYKKHKENVEE